MAYAKTKKLAKSFYLQQDVVAISKALLGKYLVTKTAAGIVTTAMIVETEAYQAPEDKASHAYGNKRTARTETMFSAGGVAYIYLCYGVHHLLNVVTGPQDVPHAVLIRAVEPIDGIDIMLQRRQFSKINYKLTSGPGVLSQALGITTADNQSNLLGTRVWLEDRGVIIQQRDIISSARVGIQYAKEYASLPWRFRLQGNPWVSKAK